MLQLEVDAVDRIRITQIEHLAQGPGLGWISSLCYGTIRIIADEQSVQMSLFDDRNLAKIRSPLYADERLLVRCDPALAARHR